ncbi:rano class II histocompatibility antigen, B alpha chain-like isoform X2 [Leptodactylus fuscus]|uniref:rano class II histocompatibility antigen, B alpha chain-like isoform X2 n=1 Tax=Leptodactylus fuscus TaxID=238119 RepID=UPI003F4E7F72
MSQRKLLTLSLFSLVCILCVTTSQAVKVGTVWSRSALCQTLEPKGEYTFRIDDDEIFNIDLENKEVRWKLPQFGGLSSYDTTIALQNIDVLKYNLDIYEKRSNYTKAKSVFQEDIRVFTEKPFLLGQPVTLICLATKFFPPVIKMSWLKNNEPVTDGVTETDYYPAPDGSFSKFIYLADLPKEGDVYTCSVEHDGLPKNPTNRPWSK